MQELSIEVQLNIAADSYATNSKRTKRIVAICEDEDIPLAKKFKISSINSSTAVALPVPEKSVESKNEAMIGDELTIKHMESLVNDPDNPLEEWSMKYIYTCSLH